MVFGGVMKEIKKFCKDDDTCIFIILILIGFLLCMFFNRDEGFLNYSNITESENDTEHQYGPAEGPVEDPGGPSIGQPPTQKEGVVEPPIGLKPINPGPPKNGFAGIDKQVEMANQGKQYQAQVFPSKGELNRIDPSLDGPSPYESPAMAYHTFAPYAQSGGPSTLPPSKMREDMPMGPSQGQGPPPVPEGQPQARSVGDNVAPVDGATGGGQNMELVLFYAPWCGHSKNMLGDYDEVTNNFDGKGMNGTKLSISKVDMDTEEGKKKAKIYNVEIKGFPTLYTFVTVNGKKVGQPFSPRDKQGIIDELQKRTQALG